MQAREYFKCRYRRGWALWLIEELRAYWSNEEKLSNQPTPDCLPISVQWTSCVFVGPSKRLTGQRAMPIRSTG